MADMLVTVDSMTGRVPAGTDSGRVQQAVEEATGLIQLATGQRLVSVTGDVVLLAGGRPSVWLPERPVVSVDAVATTVAGVTTTRTAGVDFVVFGAELRWAFPGSVWPGVVTVTYSHGYSPTVVPESLKAVCRSLAARSVVTNAGGYRSHSETQGDWSESYTVAGADVGTGLSPRELADLAPFRVPVAV